MWRDEQVETEHAERKKTRDKKGGKKTSRNTIKEKKQKIKNGVHEWSKLDTEQNKRVQLIHKSSRKKQKKQKKKKKNLIKDLCLFVSLQFFSHFRF